MYICPTYVNNWIEYDVMLSDIVLIDWQLRLISFLIDDGHIVLTKQHPETRVRMPNFFFDILGAKDIVGNFEKVYEQADIVLTDYPGSSTFGSALKTSKPVIFIDFGFRKLKSNEFNMLKKRCYVVRGSFLNTNQVNVDWNDLRAGLEECFLLNDRQYLKKAI
ncbi:hypothetical protein OAR80_02035 [Methylophilaceae bacterium]|nr:hypothetical protein [Methylophilaceae bacterium]